MRHFSPLVRSALVVALVVHLYVLISLLGTLLSAPLFQAAAQAGSTTRSSLFSPGGISLEPGSPALARYPPTPQPYLCHYNGIVGPSQVADCTDCMYFPVDKTHALPAGYRPELVEARVLGGGKMHPIAADALASLFAAAQREGLSLKLSSGYRSYIDQLQAFNQWVRKEIGRGLTLEQAVANADFYSARPGHSEHQLGTAADINCENCKPFDKNLLGNVAVWRFLERNAHRFGFVLSYPLNSETLTGYIHEPWHIRYIGVTYATELYDLGYLTGNGVCLSGFLRTKRLYERSETAPAPPSSSVTNR